MNYSDSLTCPDGPLIEYPNMSLKGDLAFRDGFEVFSFIKIWGFAHKRCLIVEPNRSILQTNRFSGQAAELTGRCDDS